MSMSKLFLENKLEQIRKPDVLILIKVHGLLNQRLKLAFPGLPFHIVLFGML